MSISRSQSSISRLDRAHWVLMVAYYAICATGLFVVISHEDLLPSGLLGYLAFMVMLLFYGGYAGTLDPFWMARKRLWTSGRLTFHPSEVEDLREPMIWEKRGLPRR